MTSHLVLQPVSPSLQVHVFSVGIVEAAFTQFTVKANHLSIIIPNLRRKKKKHMNLRFKPLKGMTKVQLFLNVTHIYSTRGNPFHWSANKYDSWISLTDSLTKRQIHSFCSSYLSTQIMKYFDCTVSLLQHNRAPQAECLLGLQYHHRPHHRSKCPSSPHLPSPPPALPELVQTFCCLERNGY